MSRTLSKTFNVTLDGQPILDTTPGNTFSVGIQYDRLVPGLVPSFEEHSVRVEAHYNLHEWESLSAEEKALEVAHYRLRHMQKLHENSAAAEQMKRRSR